MNKYFNKKTTIDNINFSSKKESTRYLQLKMLVKLGHIKDLQLQPKFELQPAYKKNGKNIRAINYMADFSYYDNQKEKYIIEDVKGFNKKTGKHLSTQEFKLKKKIFEYINQDKEIILV